MPRFRLDVCLVVLCFVAFWTIAPGPTEAARPIFGDAVDAAIAEFEVQGGPGGVVAVVAGDSLAYAAPFGMADVATGRPNTIRTRFGLASCSKQFTAACIRLLVERGSLDLQEDVRSHVPDLAIRQPVPIARLLTHSSGFPDYGELMILARGRDHLSDFLPTDIRELVRKQDSLCFTPGTDESYSNTNYLLLAEIVENVSGTGLEEFARENLFLPLGMATASFGAKPPFPGETATGYAARAEPEDPFLPAAVGPEIPGAGGVYASVEDLVRWMGHLDVESGDLAQLGEWLARRDTLADGRQTEYGRGVVSGRLGTGHRWVEHTGRSYGGTAILTWWPDVDVSTIVLTNNAEISARAISNAFFRSVLDTFPAPDVPRPDPAPVPPEGAAEHVPLEPPAPPETRPIPLERIAGLYPADAPVGTRPPPSGGVGVDRMKLEDGALTYEHHGGYRFPLEPCGVNVFELQGLGRPVRAYFETAESGQPAYRVWDPEQTGDDLSDPVERVPDLTADDLHRFTGSYRSPSLVRDVPLRIVAEESRLFLEWGVDRRRAELFPLDDRRLTTWTDGRYGMQCNLVFPAGGGAQEFRYDGHRVWNLRFVREDGAP